MKKIMMLAAALVLTGASCNLTGNNQDKPANDNGQTTYQNQQYGFSFNYGEKFRQFDGGNYGNLAEKIVQVQADNLQEGTNLLDAALTVTAQQAGTLEECLNLPAEALEGRFVNTETVNGIVYMAAEASGAAAGNRYDSRLRRVFRSDTCLEIALTLHTGNIGNYPDGSVREADTDMAWTELYRIFYTLQFTN